MTSSKTLRAQYEPVPEGFDWSTLEYDNEEKGNALGDNEEDDQVKSSAVEFGVAEDASIEKEDREACDACRELVEDIKGITVLHVECTVVSHSAAQRDHRRRQNIMHDAAGEIP